MAPKRQLSSGLADLEPTEKELELARSILQATDAKGKRAKMGSMVGFCKRHPELDDSSAALASRGESRQDYLLKYMVYVARQNETTTTTTEEAVHADAEFEDFEWLCEEQIKDRYGAAKCALWVDSKKLEVRPDRVTGSTKPEHLEHKVFKDWGRSEERQATGLKITAVGETKKTDHVNMASLRLDGSPSSSVGAASSGEQAGPQPQATGSQAATSKQETTGQQETTGKQVAPLAQVKKEPIAPSEKEIMDARVTEFMAGPSMHYKKMNAFHIECREMLQKSLNHEFGKDFHEKVLAHDKSLQRTMAAIDKIVLGTKVNHGKIPCLLRFMQKLEESHEQFLQLAKLLGFEKSGKKRKAKSQE